MSTSMVSSNQPWHKETVLESFQQLKVPPACFWQVLVMFSECTTHYTDPTRSVSAFNVMFITGMSTAVASQLFSASVERLQLI